jgi:hypothetical protein
MSKNKRGQLPSIVKRALLETVVDIGQLTAEDKNSLRQAVKSGLLSKGKGGGYPAIKTVYARPGYDFGGERAKAINWMMAMAYLDECNRQRRSTLTEERK